VTEGMRPIEISTRDGKHFVATAYLAAYGPVLAERWQRGVAAAANKTDFSVEEATAMNNKAVDDSLCHGHRRRDHRCHCRSLAKALVPRAPK
jgi:hypothetical protein